MEVYCFFSADPDGIENLIVDLFCEELSLFSLNGNSMNQNEILMTRLKLNLYVAHKLKFPLFILIRS